MANNDNQDQNNHKTQNCDEPLRVETKVESMEPRTEIRFMEYDETCRKKRKWFDQAGLSGKNGDMSGEQRKSEGQKTAEPFPSQRLLMGPPSYPDLGKNARDVFGKGYHFGLLKLDLKTKTKSNVEFSSGGVSNQDSGKVFGSLETKYRVKEYGLTFSEKWNTDNTLATEIAIQDQIAQGLKLSFDTTFAPQTGSKTGRIKSAFQNESVALNCDVDLNLSGPIVQASAVLGYNGWLAGYQSKFDSQRSKITQNNVALGYSTGDFILHTNVNDGQEFGGSIYQRVSPKLETGIQLAWTAGSNDTRFGIGAKYDLDKDAAVRAKVNNVSQIGLGYQQKLREGITLTLSALIDGKNFNQGGHKIGVALELEA
uniref:Voltage-dependent anion-selective channel n=1 Tax=Timema bartmani TaxID=61472 RepID=A0A7R9I1R4_9NEOP|nr:unnamed protein product [Timema bartmani]